MDSLTYLHQKWLWRRQEKQHRLSQGRLTTTEAAVQLSAEGHIPLASVPNHKEAATISIPVDVDGHLLLVAPPDSNWRDHLTMILVYWPGPALVVDPDGYLYQQTGYFRDTLWGKVYAIPGYRFNLARYYPFWGADAAAKVHNFLIPPVSDAEAWLLDRSVPLIQALGYYSFFHKRNPMQVLLDAAVTDLYYVLEALATVPAAWQQARRFTKGLSPWKALSEPDVVHCFTLFARQMRPYQKTYASFVVEKAEDVIPHNWSKQKSTLYLTSPLTQQGELAGLTAALVDGIRQHHHTHGRYQNLLLVMDAALAQRLPPVEQLLTEAAAYGITVILTAVSLAALDSLDTDGDGGALAGRFAHQVWYPPHDRQTAEHMAWLYGTRLRQTDDEYPAPPDMALNPHEVLAWPVERVLVYTRRERPYRFLAEQVTVPTDLPVRAAPSPPRAASTPRSPRDWLPPNLELAAYLTEPLENVGDTEVDQSAAEKRKTDTGTGIQGSLPLMFKADGGQIIAPSGEDAAPKSPGRTRLR